MHGDIRPANIQCGAAEPFETLKLIGFAGISEFTPRFGSAAYTAPEAIGGAEIDTNDVGHTVKNVFIDLKAKKDQWSVGVLTYALLTGTLPFKATKEQDLNNEIRAGTPSYEGFEKLSAAAKAFVENMIHVDVTTRWTAEEAYNSNWIREQRDARTQATIDEVDLKNTLKGLTALENE